jgi:serine/threonine-protein kinase
MTSPGSVIGTVDYMAPEQAEGRPIDPRADLWSLGAVMYACLARRPPFQARSLAEMLRKHREEQPISVKRLVPSVPVPLAQVIDRLLQKSPDDRYPNALVLLRQLRSVEDTVEIIPGVSEDPEESDFELGPASKPRNLPRTRSFGKEIPVGETRDAAVGPPVPGPPSEEPELTCVSEDVPRMAEVPPEQRTRTEPGATRFTLVKEEELDQFASGDAPEESNPLISIQTWILAASLLAVGFAVWYALQPPSPDGLFSRIQATTEDGSTQSLLDAEKDIREFLTTYPNDSRAKLLRRYTNEIDLHRLERKLERNARGSSSTKTQLPIHHDFLEALQLIQISPEAGLVKLKAIVDLYGTGGEQSGPNAQYVKLARRRVEELEKRLAARAQSQLDLIRAQLESAAEVGKTDPQAAARVYEAVVTLYGDKPWAAEMVAEAERRLENR